MLKSRLPPRRRPNPVRFRHQHLKKNRRNSSLPCHGQHTGLGTDSFGFVSVESQAAAGMRFRQSLAQTRTSSLTAAVFLQTPRIDNATPEYYPYGYYMTELTHAQRRVLEFVQAEVNGGRPVPTLREIAAHFGFAGHRAAAAHLDALKRFVSAQ